MAAMQPGFFTRPKPASWEKKHGTVFVVQMKGQNRKGEDIGWMDHAAYDVHEARRARNTANGLRKNYPGVPVRIIRKKAG